MKSIEQNSMVGFFRKIVGTLIFPTKTFALLREEPLKQSILYSTWLYLFYIFVTIITNTVLRKETFSLLNLLGLNSSKYSFVGALYYGPDPIFIILFFSCLRFSDLVFLFL